MGRGGFTGLGISEGVIRGVFHAFYEAGSTKYKGRCRIKAWALYNLQVFDWHTIYIVFVDLMEFEKKFSSTDLLLWESQFALNLFRLNMFYAITAP